MTKRPREQCAVCSDPDRFQNWLADQRIRANQLSDHAKGLRVAGDDARSRNLAASVDSPDFKRTQAEMLLRYGQANAAAQQAMLLRGEADRLESLHSKCAAPQAIS